MDDNREAAAGGLAADISSAGQSSGPHASALDIVETTRPMQFEDPEPFGAQSTGKQSRYTDNVL